MTHWKPLLPLNTHSTTLRKTHHRLFHSAKLHSERLFKAGLCIWNLSNDTELIHMQVWTSETSHCSNPDYIICTRALPCSCRDEWQNSKLFGLWLDSPKGMKVATYWIAFTSHGMQHLTALKWHKTHTHNPQMSVNKNESKDVRGKQLMPPSFLPTPLPPSSNCHTVFPEKKEVMLSKSIFTVF